MKIVLSFSIATLIYFGSILNLLDQVDFKGIYHASSSHPNIINEYLDLKEGGFFEYRFLYFDKPVSSTHTIKGRYKIQENQLRLFPVSFENNSDYQQQPEKGSRIKIHETAVSAHKKTPLQSSSKSFKKDLTAFESGLSRLKPSYYFKQTKDKLSLCQMDLKTEQYRASFAMQK